MKILLLFSTICIVSKVVQSQTNLYHPFPDSNAVWTWEACVGPPPMCGSNVYFFDGDTVVNSLNYHKLYFYGQSIVGGIRNDTISNKTYFICFNPSSPINCSSHIQEKILYDFSAGIGDTVFYGTCGYDWIVTSIDSIQLLDGTYRKQFNCSFGYVIESIGANGNPICGTQDGMAFLSLLCFQKDATTYYTSPPNPLYNPNPNSCLTLVGIQEQNATFGLTIYPNPFSAQTVLQSDNPFHNATLILHNYLGQTVAQIKNISGKIITFNRDDLPSGLYFPLLKEGNKTITVDKLVITDN